MRRTRTPRRAGERLVKPIMRRIARTSGKVRVRRPAVKPKR
jgi:hypothetical protein